MRPKNGFVLGLREGRHDVGNQRTWRFTGAGQLTAIA